MLAPPLAPGSLIEEHPAPPPPATLLVRRNCFGGGGVAPDPADLELVGVLGAQRRRPRRQQHPNDSDSPHGPTPRYLVRSEKCRSEERRVGKSVDLGGRRIIKKKKKKKQERERV